MVGPGKYRLDEGDQKPQAPRRGNLKISSASSCSSDAPSARSEKRVVRSSRGYDGNDDAGAMTVGDPKNKEPTMDTRNFDLGISGWATARGVDMSGGVQKPALSKLGTPAKVGINTYHVDAFPNLTIYQFDVDVGSGVENRGAIMKVWESKAVQAEMGASAIFDGNKLAWSSKPIDREVRLTVDLDAEQGRETREGQEEKNKFRVRIRQTNKVGFTALLHYLQGKASFNSSCLEAINFADHLLRQTPSKKYSSIKRAFFPHGGTRFVLGGGVEAFKGVYQSLRLVHPGHLSINADVANGTFWQATRFTLAANLVCGGRDISDLASRLSEGGPSSIVGKNLKRMAKIRVTAEHRGKDTVDKYCIDKFIYTNAKNQMIDCADAAGKPTKMSLYAYFATKYNIMLQWPSLPLVKMTKGKNTILPMEVLRIVENQRYNYKMDERQTSNMIKFAVTAPPERYRHIQEGIDLLNWAEDPVLKEYGVKINATKATAEGRVLPAPIVKFGLGEAKPGTSGRWDLKGKKFFQPNTTPLKTWAICCIPGRRGGKPDKTVIEAFIKAFIAGYIAHGGKVENKAPSMVLASGTDVGEWVTAAWNGAGNQTTSRPQMLMFVLPDKDTKVYGRIKRSAECRYGVVSQCVQYAHAQKMSPQYISNVCMKFNCKLGGITCRAIGPKTPNGIFTKPTMVIGADISHGAPGAHVPSIAALTVSMDKLATRYAAVVQTNGYRNEMVKTETIMHDLKLLVHHWIQTVGGNKMPHEVIYLRDGVSEGQYAHVMDHEVGDIKNMFRAADPSAKIKFVVVVGSKRHHVRFFPEKGDRNGNPFPGTLVETTVTNPFENDFYLCSHAAIKGTARPCHYYVLANEADMSNNQLHTLLYEHAYQYQRASTPISQHPAIYYAHLAAARAAPHDPIWDGSTDGRTPAEKKMQARINAGSEADKKSATHGSAAGTPTLPTPEEAEKLLPMPPQGNIAFSMWYI